MSFRKQCRALRSLLKITNCLQDAIYSRNFHESQLLLSASKHLDWNKAVSDAEKIVGYPTSFMSLRCLLSDEFSNVAMHMRKLVGTNHPLLKTARGLVYDGRHNMQTRGLMVLLISKAAGPRQQHKTDQDMIGGIYPSQRSLAEITEMIHTANLIHKGVLNLTDFLPSNGDNLDDMEFGNKMAVLSGDFLLANACTELADLRNTMVVETISDAIGDLMKAEFTELKDDSGQGRLPCDVKFSDWFSQTYYTSASLLAKSCKSALVLAGHTEDFQNAAHDFGKNMAYAQQGNFHLCFVLALFVSGSIQNGPVAGHTEDFQNAAHDFGKNMAYAQQIQEDLKPFHHPEEYLDQFSVSSVPVIKYVEAKKEHRDIVNNSPEMILDYVKGMSVISDCEVLCQEYGEAAKSALDIFDPSEAKLALMNMVDATVKSPS